MNRVAVQFPSRYAKAWPGVYNSVEMTTRALMDAFIALDCDVRYDCVRANLFVAHGYCTDNITPPLGIPSAWVAETPRTDFARSFVYALKVPPASKGMEQIAPMIGPWILAPPPGASRRGIILDHPWPGHEVRWERLRAALAMACGGEPLLLLDRSVRDVALEQCRVPLLPYHAYLAATSGARVFVVTHPGCFNHSIIDMACRGIVVVARRSDVSEVQLPFVHACDTDQEMVTVATGALLGEAEAHQARCTSFEAVARRVLAWYATQAVGEPCA